MTPERIIQNVERWEIALQKAQDSQIRLKRRLEAITVKVEKLKAKTAKNKAYKSYWEREGLK